MSSAEPPGPEPEARRLSAEELPRLAKVVAVSSLRIGAWAAVTGLGASRRVVDVIRHPDHAAELAHDLRVAASAITLALAGKDAPGAGQPDPAASVLADAVDGVDHPRSPELPLDPLHAAAQELLRRSRDVWTEDRGHPAYARIIEELAPDEGRILLLLLHKGPQASVDVRSGGLIGTSGSTLVRANLNMIGSLAGCRYVDRVPSYLHNLERLGLIWFSGETVADPMEYQVLEAQPEVQDVRHSVRRPKVIRRSIHLTPFGEDFCRDGLGLPLEGEVLGDVPPHGRPERR